jgi:hypothetical protein
MQKSGISLPSYSPGPITEPITELITELIISCKEYTSWYSAKLFIEYPEKTTTYIEEAYGNYQLEK